MTGIDIAGLTVVIVIVAIVAVVGWCSITRPNICSDCGYEFEDDEGQPAVDGGPYGIGCSALCDDCGREHGFDFPAEREEARIKAERAARKYEERLKRREQATNKG